MCGIAGFSFVNGATSRDAAVRVLHEMTRSLAHRGPDGEGVALIAGGEGSLTGVGHRRLSILELSSAGTQPMSSRSGRFVLAFNGEIYNHRELRAFIEARRGPQPWRGHSDTEVLVELVAEVGLLEALGRLDGQYAIAVHDREERTLGLARDPFGEKPLYYTMWEGVLLFASELRALRAWPGFAPRQDETALADFFRYGYVPSPATIYEGVMKLPPASVLVVRDADIGQKVLPTPQSHWDPVSAASSARARGFIGTSADAASEVEQALRDSVAARMIADVPVGAFLSGGIDSSLTTALMQTLSPRPVRTFSLGIDMPGYDESGSARSVAQMLGTVHSEVRVSPSDVLAAIPELLRVHDEPFADSSQIPTLLLSRAAQAEVKVVLSGDGGDELFAGYNRYVHGPGLWARASSFPRPARRLAGSLLQALPERWIDRATRVLGGLAPRELAAGRAGAKLHKLGKLLESADPQEFHDRTLAIGDPSRVIARATGYTRLSGRIDPRAVGLGPVEAAMLLDTANYLPDDVLTKVDRASMAVGLEVRTPFLNRSVFDLAWRLPMDMKLRSGKGKLVLRDALVRHLPERYFTRPKAGFGVPIGDWLRGPLREWADSLLSGRALSAADSLDAASVRRLWQEHGKGHIDRGPELWSVLMYLGWLGQTQGTKDGR